MRLLEDVFLTLLRQALFRFIQKNFMEHKQQPHITFEKVFVKLGLRRLRIDRYYKFVRSALNTQRVVAILVDTVAEGIIFAF
jgi:hypothetical protein